MGIFLITTHTLSFKVAGVAINRTLLTFLSHNVTEIGHWATIQTQFINRQEEVTGTNSTESVGFA